jgi:hypothetical protein
MKYFWIAKPAAEGQDRRVTIDRCARLGCPCERMLSPMGKGPRYKRFRDGQWETGLPVCVGTEVRR